MTSLKSHSLFYGQVFINFVIFIIESDNTLKSPNVFLP